MICMYICSISIADRNNTQSCASDSHLSTCSTEEGAREENQVKGSTSQSSHEISDALPQENARVGANLPIIDESDTNRKRKSAEGSVSIVFMHNGVI